MYVYYNHQLKLLLSSLPVVLALGFTAIEQFYDWKPHLRITDNMILNVTIILNKLLLVKGLAELFS